MRTECFAERAARRRAALAFSVRAALCFALGATLWSATSARAQRPRTVSADAEASAQNAYSQDARAKAPVASELNLRCASYIENTAAEPTLEIVGGEQEQEHRYFSQGDYVYINSGGVSVGQEFSIIRPRGKFKSKWSAKKGALGTYTQEVGRVRVVRLKGSTAVAQIVGSCAMVMLGDLLRPVPVRQQIMPRNAATLDRFSDPSGKQQGRIVLARDTQELIGGNQVVFIDLGAEDNVRVGDSLTIFRPAGTGNLLRFRDDEVVQPASGGFESDRYKGGKFSNQAPRTKNPDANPVTGAVASRPDVKRRRPPLPRKVVGELVILDVQQRTAAAVITRTTQEVHTGDYVEVQ